MCRSNNPSKAVFEQRLQEGKEGGEGLMEGQMFGRRDGGKEGRMKGRREGRNVRSYSGIKLRILT